MPEVTTLKQGRILDFDTECRPMHYSEWRPESQITAYAWSWIGSDKVASLMLKQDMSNERQNLETFLAAYNSADVVTGHYIRRHDLPLINDHCVRLDLPPLSPKLVSDTKVDFVRVSGLGLSQENLALMLELDEDKHHMAGALWRKANALTNGGQQQARKRVVSDVRQHKALRAELLERGLLKTPKVWKP